MTNDELKAMIDAIQDQAVNLTSWERDFIKSVVGQFKMRGWLSPKQKEIVERIYTEKTPTGSPFGQETNVRPTYEESDLLDELPSTRRNMRRSAIEKYGDPHDI